MYFYVDSFTAKPVSDKELDALGLINSMLTETLYSRILGTARERGLVYNMSSSFARAKDSTNWWFGAQVRSDNAPALFDIMVLELGKVFAGELTDADLEAAKQYAIGRYQRSGQTVAGISSGYAQRYFFDEVIEDYYEMPSRINAITKRGIVNASTKLFTDKIWGFGVLGQVPQNRVGQLHQQLAVLWR
jgi:predicted Zn-dependent peptidase